MKDMTLYFFERYKALLVLLALALVVFCGCDPQQKVATPTPKAYCVGVQCDGKVAGTEKCPMVALKGSLTSSPIYTGTGNVGGEVQMRYSERCQSADAELTLSKSLWYTVGVYRYHITGPGIAAVVDFTDIEAGIDRGKVMTPMVGVITSTPEETPARGSYEIEILVTVRASQHAATSSQTIVDYAA